MSFAQAGWILCFVTFGIVSGCLDRPLVESQPSTSNLFVDQVRQSSVDKIDLLFMVDNSASMADKQDILRDAVPVLVSRLTSPLCVDPITGVPTGEKGTCTKGEPEFQAVADIHVGIVTSSLGAHAGSRCADAASNDRAHLLGKIRPVGSARAFDVAQTWNGSGFLAWDSAQTAQPAPGVKDPVAFQSTFQNMIEAAGETGCGFEASLESWYRFLIDPEPPLNVTKDAAQHSVRGSALVTNADGSTTCNGCDLELLAQRKAFLRPDSLVAIIMLSDENDCSVRDDGVGWFVTTDSDGFRVPRATAACAMNPNDKCCRSCADSSPVPAGCPALKDDEVCKTAAPGQIALWDAPHDHVNRRCSEQKKRFGVDLLYPTSRYVDALTSPTLTLQSDGKTRVENPLYVAGTKTGVRDPSNVFLAGIVGVPWQDIADDDSRSGSGLRYLTAAELLAKDRWSVLLGKPDASPPVPPSDPFMIESPGKREGKNPITNDAIVPATSSDPKASPINGHEQNIPNLDDLQYACTFPLANSKQCHAGDDGCDCAPSGSMGTDVSGVVQANSPLCQPVAGGTASTLQNYAKAYPGTRELQVLKDLSEQGIVASICPKVTASADPAHDANYGYNPAVAAIIERLKIALTGKCLPRAIQADPDTHQVLCKVIEAQTSGCNCQQAGRAPADPKTASAVRRQLEEDRLCGGPLQVACSSFCQCEILQEKGTDLDACRHNQSAAPGFCYIDDPASSLLTNCPVNQKRLLHFVSGVGAERTPALGAYGFISCLGAPLASAESDGGI